MAKATPIQIGTKKGLPFYRKFLYFSGSDETETINVVYEEYLLSPSGDKVELVNKEYIIKDRVVLNKDNQDIGTKRYTYWDSQLGNVIRSAINDTLENVIPVSSKVIEHI